MWVILASHTALQIQYFHRLHQLLTSSSEILDLIFAFAREDTYFIILRRREIFVRLQKYLLRHGPLLHNRLKMGPNDGAIVQHAYFRNGSNCFWEMQCFYKALFYGGEQIGATFLSEILQTVCALLLSQATYW